MARKNEYEMTFCKQESCFYLFEEINDINRLFGEVQNRYPKYKNYLYLISGNLNYKKRITIKLDDGKLFFCQSKKERISKIEDELQHYYEYADKEKKWHDIDGLSRMNNLFSNDNYNRNLLRVDRLLNALKIRLFKVVKCDKKQENVGNSYFIPALFIYHTPTLCIHIN